MILSSRLHDGFVFRFVLLLFFAVLPLSYVPTVTLGQYAQMNLDVSLIYVVLAITALTFVVYTPFSAYMTVWRDRSHNSIIALSGLVLFGILTLISTVWSTNPIKGLFTALYFCLIVIVVVNLYIHRVVIYQHRIRYLYAFGVSLVASIIFAYWQIYADAFGLSSTWTQLPQAYQSHVFGFTRPTGFSLEPQFFGSLLMPAALYLSFRIVNGKSTLGTKLSFTALCTILLLTMSRGAIYAFAISFIVMLVATVFMRYRKQQAQYIKSSFICVGLYIISIILCAGVVISSVHINKREDLSAVTAISRYINQMSLGTINIAALINDRQETESQPLQKQSVASDTTPNENTSAGYVEESTDSRLSMSTMALMLWRDHPLTMLFGVGYGGYGLAVHEYDSIHAPHSIVNNYYLEVLVETGISGFVLLFGSLILFAYGLLRRRQILLLSILVGICLQMFFYSGNANTIHVWICVALCAMAIRNIQPKSNITID